MARPATASPDRAAQTVRMPPSLKERLEGLADDDRVTLNDYIVTVLQQHADEQARVDRQLRAVVDAAIGLASPVVKALEVKTGHRMDSDARLMAIEAALTFGVAEAVRMMLQPPKEMAGIATLWSMLLKDAQRLGLKGAVWDYIRTLGPNSPPPTQEHVAALSKEIAKLKERGLSGDEMEAVKSLDAWLGLAVHEHAETWSDFQERRETQRRTARTELYTLLADNSARKKPKK